MNAGTSAASAVASPWAKLSLGRVFWIGALLLVILVVATAHPQYSESTLGACLITVAALLPVWLWMTGKTFGFPLFPLFSATHIPTHALPLLYEHPIVSLFPANNQLIAAATVTGFLLLGTLIWYLVARSIPRPPRSCLLLRPGSSDLAFLIAIGGSLLLNIATTAQWLNLPFGIFTLVRAVALSLQALGCFALSYRMGSGELSKPKSITFKLLLSFLVISNIPTLPLTNAMSVILIAGIGYTLGARRVPWLTMLISLLGFAFLHAGKSDMRQLFWVEDQSPPLSPWKYPSFIREWIHISAGNVVAGKSEAAEEEHTLLERASLMQLLLYVQVMTPNEVSFLDGETYAIIPRLLIPRFLDPDKPASHEGTYLLNIHYGFQTREATATTTIGFGLLNEAFANFGYPGVMILALVLGIYYGGVSRWAEAVPVLSFRSLFAIIVANSAFQTEYSASVYVTALFQATCALCVVAAIFMRPGNLKAGAITLPSLSPSLR